MFRVFISNAETDLEWDEFVERVPYGQYSQTSLWSQVKALQGWQPLRILIKARDDIVAGVQILTRPLPISGRAGAIWRGPLVGMEGEPELNDILWQALVDTCRRSHVYYLAIALPAADNSLIGAARTYGFRETLLGDIDARAEIVVDLAPDLEEIYHRISKNRRKLIHRGETRGICVREGDEGDLAVFYQLHAASAHRLGFSLYPEEFFEALWRVFAPASHVKLFIAEYEGQPVSAQINLLFRDSMIAYRIGWSGEYSGLYPNDEIHWHAIRWAKEHGFHWFNFMGIETPVAEALLRGQPIPPEYEHTYSQYKLHFGGQLVFYPPTYDRIFLPTGNWLYRKLFPLVRESSLVKQVIKTFSGMPV